MPLRVHVLLDDASRYVVAIRAFSTEREVDMLELLAQALRSADSAQDATPRQRLHVSRRGAGR